MPNNFLFNLLAPFYDRVFENRSSETVRELLDLNPDQRLLDVGGGTGRVSAPLRAAVQDLFLGDYSFAMLRESKKKQVAIPFQISSLHLPFSDETFDRILVVDAMHHFPEQPLVMVELLRVLKTGGRLVIEEPDIQHWGVKLVALGEKLALMGSHFHTPKELQAMALAAAANVSIHHNKGPAAWIVAKK